MILLFYKQNSFMEIFSEQARVQMLPGNRVFWRHNPSAAAAQYNLPKLMF